MRAFTFCLALCVLVPVLEGQRGILRPPVLPPNPRPPLPKPPILNVPSNGGKPPSGGSVNLQVTQRPSGSGTRGPIKISIGITSMPDEIEDIIQSGADEMKLSSLLVALMMLLTHVLGSNRLW